MKRSILPRAAVNLDAETKVMNRALGAVLRDARTQRGESRAKFSSRLLISPATLQRMEEGDPRVSLGYYLAVGRALNTPVLAMQDSPRLNLAPLLLRKKLRSKRKLPSDDWFK